MSSCLVLSHGQIAQVFLDAAQKITGRDDHLYSLDCDSSNPRDLHEKIIRLIETKNLKDGLFILVSLRGGSCWNAAARIVKEYDKVQLISGLNLSMILSFITKRHLYDFEALGTVLLNDSARAITQLK